MAALSCSVNFSIGNNGIAPLLRELALPPHTIAAFGQLNGAVLFVRQRHGVRTDDEMPNIEWYGHIAVHVGSSITQAEQALIVATLEHTHGDKPKAATILGISLKTLYNRLSIYKAAHA